MTIIRNEELILLSAEAKWGLNRLDEAVADLNHVRDGLGRASAADLPLTADQIGTRSSTTGSYSLLFEGGHRWIDMRRFGLLASFAAEDPAIG